MTLLLQLWDHSNCGHLHKTCASSVLLKFWRSWGVLSRLHLFFKLLLVVDNFWGRDNLLFFEYVASGRFSIFQWMHIWTNLSVLSQTSKNKNGTELRGDVLENHRKIYSDDWEHRCDHILLCACMEVQKYWKNKIFSSTPSISIIHVCTQLFFPFLMQQIYITWFLHLSDA